MDEIRWILNFRFSFHCFGLIFVLSFGRKEVFLVEHRSHRKCSQLLQIHGTKSTDLKVL